jgi:HD-GYP domain-containing protein (c-di-GMP phosphodiesterase class II)
MITITQKEISHKSQYILFNIKKLALNSYVPFDIFIKKSNGFVLIIRASTFLSDDIYNKLAKQDKLYIAAQSNGIVGLQCSHLLKYIQININSNKKILDFLYIIHKKNYPHLLQKERKEGTVVCLNYVVESIIYIIKEKKNFIKDTISYFSDSFELDILSLHVTLYAINLGSLLHLKKEALLQLGLASLLHDIGEKAIDASILKKGSKLDTHELNLVYQHPEQSVIIANHNFIHDPYIIDAIMHHHERYDGSGYPDALFEKEISQFTSIIGICDVFNALISDRPYRNKLTYFEALKFMIKDESMINKFNHNYLQTFLKSLI